VKPEGRRFVEHLEAYVDAHDGCDLVEVGRWWDAKDG